MKPLNAGHILVLVFIGILAASYLSIEDIDATEHGVYIEKSFELDKQKVLDINLSSEDILISTEDTQTFKIVYEDTVFSSLDKEQLEDKVVIKENDNKIVIYKKDDYVLRGNVFKAIGYFLRYGVVRDHIQGRCTIIVPEDFKENIQVDVSSGEIFMSDFEGALVDLDTSSGDIDLENISVDELKTHSSSGEVTFNDVAAEKSISVDTSSGDKRLKDIHTGFLKLEGSSGEVYISGYAKEVNVDTSSGDVVAENLVTDKFVSGGSSGTVSFSGSADNVDIETSSGEIYFETNILKGSYKFDSSSGTISLTLPDDEPFLFESDRSSGDFSTKIDLEYNKRNDDYARGYYIDDDTEVMIEMSSSSGDHYLK